MVSKIVIIQIMVAVIGFSSSVLYFQQQNDSGIEFQTSNVNFDEAEWNTPVTNILPKEEIIENGWTFLWSDSSQNFEAGELPITHERIIEDDEIFSTSYSYSHKSFGTYQVLIWKGGIVSDWNPQEAVEKIILQTDAETKKVIDSSEIYSNCVIGYYDVYGDQNVRKNDLLFVECAKQDYRVRVNHMHGEHNQEAIDMLVYLSNSMMGKI
jgi:hypothetical protein